MNLLHHETSPYLKQHADNPVNWYPWGEAALAAAREQNKPVFLSVGYSACHWCHVMAHESFENEDVAQILNEHYICIKMDREEYPDLDHYFMMATSILTGRGGWPNSVWLLPDGRPWYAGTYFPREDRDGQTGFKTLLLGLADLWKRKQPDVLEQAENITHAMAEQQHFEPPDPSLANWSAETWSRHIQQHYRKIFDARWGGFGSAPKFPPHTGLNLLLTTLEHAPSPETEIMIQVTLDAMAAEGLHDKIGGGFHRYATDEKWFLPHFEKMLYDNAMLLKAYARAAVAFDRPDYRKVARDLVYWLRNEMTHPEGGFYAALDADSKDGEGYYYTWTWQELGEILSPSAFEAVCKAYRIEPEGTVHDEATGRPTGRNLPCMGDLTGIDPHLLEEARSTMRDARLRRSPPGIDTKIITAWNGLMISALAVAGHLLKEPSMIMVAQRARAFIERNLIKKGHIARCWTDGTCSAHDGRLEDYAALILADLDLFKATGQKNYLETAAPTMDLMRELFFDIPTGELFMARADEAIMNLRVKDRFDQGSPSSSGLAIQAMIRMGQTLNDDPLIYDGLRAATYGCGMAFHAPSTVAALLEGMLLADDFIGTEDDDVVFLITPEIVRFDVQGEATATLSAKMPEGWQLNEVFQKRKGKPSALSCAWIKPAPPVTFEVLWVQTNLWRLTLRKKKPDQAIVGVFTLGITCQVCTEESCWPSERFDTTIKLA